MYTGKISSDFASSLVKEDLVQDIFTLFPVTFHDYEYPIYVYEPDEFAQTGFDPYQVPTSFFLRHPGFVNETIYKAHDLIMDDCVSPYAAWAQVTRTPLEKLPEILGLSLKQTDFYLKNHYLSPPKEAVRRFCDALGVHPAYLLPGTRAKDYYYHHSVVAVMADLLENPDTPEKDRELCLRAFGTEQKRYEAFKKERPVDHAYLVEAAKKFIASGRAARFSNLMSLFGNAVRNEPDYMSLALNDYESFLQDRKTFSGTVKDEANEKAHVSMTRLLEYGEKFYGRDNSWRPVFRLVRDINDAFKKQNHISADEDVVTPLSFIEEYKLERPHPLFVYKNFTRDLARLLQLKPTAAKAEITHIQDTKNLAQFQAWRKIDNTTRLEIPLFLNNMLIENYLPSNQSAISPARQLAVLQNAPASLEAK